MFKKNLFLGISFFVLFFLFGCNSMPGTVYMTDVAKNANMSIVTIPQAVAGLTFVNGYTDSWGWGYSAQEIGILTANDLAKKGWTNLVILVELLNQGGGGFGPYASSQKSLVRVSWYKE